MSGPENGAGRVQRYAKALEREFGGFLAHSPHRPEVFWTGAARDVIAVADAEQADLRAEVGAANLLVRLLRSHVEAQTLSVWRWQARAGAVEAERDALRETVERVRVLADEWGWMRDEDEAPTRFQMWQGLRAALSEPRQGLAPAQAAASAAPAEGGA